MNRIGLLGVAAAFAFAVPATAQEQGTQPTAAPSPSMQQDQAAPAARTDGAPVKGLTVKVGKNPGSDFTWKGSSNMAPGDAGASAPAQRVDNVNPVTGIGIVVKPNKRVASPPANGPAVCDHAINTKGSGAVARTTDPGTPAPDTQTGTDPKNPQCALKTRTKSNSTNE